MESVGAFDLISACKQDMQCNESRSAARAARLRLTKMSSGRLEARDGSESMSICIHAVLSHNECLMLLHLIFCHVLL